jgi:hypothetical protein
VCENSKETPTPRGTRGERRGRTDIHTARKTVSRIEEVPRKKKQKESREEKAKGRKREIERVRRGRTAAKIE